MPPDPGGRVRVFPTHNIPDSRTMSPAWTGGRALGGSSRSFEQIVEEEKKNRNILEIQITKILSEDQNGEQVRPRSLTFEELGEFIFDVLKIDPEECLAVNLNTGRYDQREVKMKPTVNVTKYLRLEPIDFKDHKISVTKQSQSIMKITFNSNC